MAEPTSMALPESLEIRELGSDGFKKERDCLRGDRREEKRDVEVPSSTGVGGGGVVDTCLPAGLEGTLAIGLAVESPKTCPPSLRSGAGRRAKPETSPAGEDKKSFGISAVRNLSKKVSDQRARRLARGDKSKSGRLMLGKAR